MEDILNIHKDMPVIEQISSQDTLMNKLSILSDAAKYDVACTSSGVDRAGDGTHMGNCTASGICHTFAADGRCVSLLKILMTNECIFNCAYCMNNCNNDVPRATFTPEEICKITIEFYRRNYIEGLFLSSGVIVSPSYTMEKMYETIYLLRYKYDFRGYIHLKAIPGAPYDIIEKVGFLVDRMSINMEFPTSKSLEQLAPFKTRNTILTPMRHIQDGIINSKNELMIRKGHLDRRFVPAGQSTQMIIGATADSDYHIMSVAEGLYSKFQLKRVFYSAFVNVNHDSNLPVTKSGPPLLREHRLYQADWLLRYYKFSVGELLDENNKNFNVLFDPKCDWALRHLEYFPVEINKADYYTLLRVPGIGSTSARRIVGSRRGTVLDFEDIKKMGVVLKRALYFITCKGQMMYKTKLDEDYISRNLLSDKTMIPSDIRNSSYKQISLFDDEDNRELQLDVENKLQLMG